MNNVTGIEICCVCCHSSSFVFLVSDFLENSKLFLIFAVYKVDFVGFDIVSSIIAFTALELSSTP